MNPFTLSRSANNFSPTSFCLIKRHQESLKVPCSSKKPQDLLRSFCVINTRRNPSALAIEAQTFCTHPSSFTIHAKVCAITTPQALLLYQESKSSPRCFCDPSASSRESRNHHHPSASSTNTKISPRCFCKRYQETPTFAKTLVRHQETPGPQ